MVICVRFFSAMLFALWTTKWCVLNIQEMYIQLEMKILYISKVLPMSFFSSILSDDAVFDMFSTAGYNGVP